MLELDLKESLHINILDRIIDVIHSTDDIIDIFDEATKQLSQVVKCDHVNIMLNNEKARYFCIIQALNQSSPQAGEEIIIPYNETSLTEIIHSRRSIVRQDLSSRGELTPGDVKILPGGTKSDLSVPITCKNRIFAIIHLSSYEANYFTELHQDQTEQVASLIGLAVERSELIEKLNRKQSDFHFWKNKFNSLYNSISQPVAVIRLDYDLIYETNLAFQKLTGFSADELQGERLSQLHPLQEELILSTLDKCAAGEKGLEIKRLTLNRKDGLSIPVKVKLLFLGGNTIKFAFALYEEIVKTSSLLAGDTESDADFMQLQLAVINEINQLANADLESDGFIREALLAIKKAVDFDYAQLALFDDENNNVETHTIISDRSRQLDDQKNWNVLEKCDFCWFRTDRQPLKAGAVTNENINENIEHALRSRAAAILATKNSQPGTLILGHLDPNFYQHHQLEFINQVADQIAIIIDNLILKKKYSTMIFHSSVQLDLNRMIGTDLTIENVLSNIVKLSAEKMGAQLSTIQLIEADDRLTGIATSDPLCDSKGIAKFEAEKILPQLENSKQPYCIKNIFHEDLALESAALSKLSEFVSCGAIFLKSNNNTIGILSNYWKKPFQADAEKLCLLQAIAAQATAAIENARNFQEAIAYSDRLKMANLDLENFIETISCNLKNPLATIQGLGATLLDMLKDEISNEAIDYLKRIKNKAIKLQRYLDNLQALAKVGQVVHPFEDIDVAQIIERATDSFLHNIIARNIKIVAAKDLPQIYGDRNLMQQLFEKLLEHAMGELGEDHDKPKIEIGYREENHNQIFFVHNNGTGKRKAYYENVFDLLHHIDSSESEETQHKIGLVIAKKILEIHKGQIWYESKEGKGSTIFISLPRKKN